MNQSNCQELDFWECISCHQSKCTNGFSENQLENGGAALINFKTELQINSFLIYCVISCISTKYRVDILQE